MRILFINPNCAPALNMGLTYLMSAVERRNEITLLDLGLYGAKYQASLQRCLKQNPELVAISAVTQNFCRACQVADAIKRHSPATKIIFGGVHPTLCPEEVMAQPAVDALCIGEGEGAFKEYLDCLSQGQEPLVRGIWFKNCRGDWVQNPPRPFCQDLDTLAFPNWDYWDIEYYIKYIDMERMGFISSRGCPYSCAFCSHAALRQANTGNYLRTRDPQRIIAEIEINLNKYAQHNFKYVKFDDDIFGLDSKFLENFCMLYIKKGLHRKLPWFCQTRADLVTDRYADLIAQAGCAVVGFGIESGDDATRAQVYKKEVSQKAIAKAVERLNRRNIGQIFYFIYNSPFAGKRENKKTLKLIKALKPLRVNFTLYMHLPKTELEERLARDPGRANFKRKNISPSGRGLKDKLLLVLCLFYRTRNSLQSGLSLKGGGFLLDAMKNLILLCFRPRGKYPVTPGAERIFFQLEHFTLFKYAVERSRKNIKPSAAAKPF